MVLAEHHEENRFHHQAEGIVALETMASPIADHNGGPGCPGAETGHRGYRAQGKSLVAQGQLIRGPGDRPRDMGGIGLDRHVAPGVDGSGHKGQGGGQLSVEVLCAGGPLGQQEAGVQGHQVQGLVQDSFHALLEMIQIDIPSKKSGHTPFEQTEDCLTAVTHSAFESLSSIVTVHVLRQGGGDGYFLMDPF